MVLRADDELRHPHSEIAEWRESMWYCFDMPEYEMGGALYYSYMPNAPTPSARLIMYITKGWNTEPNTLLYHFDKEFPIPAEDWDDLDVGGIARFKRIEPLKKWEISFNDGKRLSFEFEADLYAGNWHYIDNLHETPKYLAGDRYHRPYAGKGKMVLDGKDYPLDFTGDSDHSWGPRRWGPLYKSKYIAGQCGQGWAFQLMEVEAFGGGLYPYGFIWDGTKMSPITKIEVTPKYDADGQHSAVVMNLVDDENRLTRIDGKCFASAPTEFNDVWNNDAYFNFEVNGGEHKGSGILSFYWNREYYHRVMRRGG
tara:strand:+ start:7955 stop:8887 length:933 start_codon:yes stop_codon:yes gene_type:complete